ncbi:hypothetical protein J5289_03585 [Rhizobium sp. B230/85]|uniref:AbiJ-NTD4 domain-containing protein n=1 Tax=unclassified Rhizobium TaxID=2613769 RepID=UPI001ADC2D06|nr:MULTISPECIES: hypothetical protein [unclassified Rhizobium]MBO9134195.1 hypothetical protein [Rhizobium sp. B209b/85]QXZ96677.1 hypothetical protein J5289_03585 [Rhizobium sp. B230/85]
MSITQLSFEQREGLVELPRQLALGEVDRAVKAGLWFVVADFIEACSFRGDYGGHYLGDQLAAIAKRHFVTEQNGYIDEFKDTPKDVLLSWKFYFREEATYGETLGFTEWLVRADNGRTNIGEAVERVLVETRCAYRLVDGDTIMPVSSEEEAATFRQALGTLENAMQPGARKHLLDAASHVSQGHFADSVRESIHSVEAFVRNLTGQSKFATAVSQIAADRNLHGSFRQALLNLYGYSSDEQGIRHPLLDKGDSNVTEQDALFMLGVCSAFVTYLTPAKA